MDSRRSMLSGPDRRVPGRHPRASSEDVNGNGRRLARRRGDENGGGRSSEAGTTPTTTRSLKNGAVEWSVTVRPGVLEGTYDLTASSREGHMLHTRARGTSARDAEDALKAARTLHWTDLEGRTWTFTREMGLPGGADLVHVHLGTTRMGSIRVWGPVELTALASDRLFELLFVVAGQRSVLASSAATHVSSAPR